MCKWLKILYILILDLYAVNSILRAGADMLLLTAEHTLSVITIIYILSRGVRQLRRANSRKLSRVIIGYIVFCVGCVAALALFYARPFSGYSPTYALGTAGFIFFLFDAACREMYEQLERNVDLDLRAKLAYIDALTDINNRAAFHARQVSDRGSAGSIAYIMADINNLKVTNDTLGHKAGDEIIIRAAKCLREAVGAAGDCYRIGGDEFVACFHGVSESEVRECIERFHSLTAQANEHSELKLSAACGYAWTDSSERDLDRLLSEADAAMYAEKQKIKAGR